MRLDPDFAALMSGHDLVELDRDHASIVGVCSELRIRFVNQGWLDFANSNDGASLLERWPLGAELLTGLSGELCDFYRDLFTAALGGEESIGLEYECSSPDLQRYYHMQVFPLRRRGLLISHTLVRAAPHPAVGGTHPDTTIAEYRQANGLALQCASCRRWRHPGKARWDWVPHLLRGRWSDVSHGICEPCAGFYYPR